MTAWDTFNSEGDAWSEGVRSYEPSHEWEPYLCDDPMYKMAVDADYRELLCGVKQWRKRDHDGRRPFTFGAPR